MTVPIFNPIRLPDQGAEVAIKPNVLTTTLGDEYVQRTPNGINTMLRKMTLNWTNLTNAEANTILTFFKQQAGYKPFYWTPIGESTQLVFVCSTWKYKYLSGGFCTISGAQFEEAAPT